jgi:cephalosporin hydroxylase
MHDPDGYASTMLRSDAEPFEQHLESSLRDHWFDRLDRHFADSYMGVRLLKFPEDLRVYEHLLWEMRADTVIEIGAENGGSALWFRDRLEALARYGRVSDPHVISIDIAPERAREGLAAVDPSHEERITLLQGDVLDPQLPARVRTLLSPDARCFVIEDSAHVHATSLAALRGFADFVPVGGWFVVEDGCVDVDALRPSEDWPRGVQLAIAEWLASPEGVGFAQRRDAELYGLTCHPGGFLQRER